MRRNIITTLEIPRHEVQRRLAMDNPWWQAGRGIDEEERAWPKRAYYAPFANLAMDRSIRRAVVLMGPRRVGKTVMLHQLVQELIDSGTRGIDILYLALDTPLYAGRTIESLYRLFKETMGHDESSRPWVIFDEIQYLKDWGVHLKSLVDSYPEARFIASGSAAAALKMQSMESGAGRFTDFVLPPLTFAEFLHFKGRDKALIRWLDNDDVLPWASNDIDALNQEYIEYLNYGGFPEAVVNPSIRGNPSRFLRQDVVEKVLLKDLPSLYGISNTQELSRFFNVIAFNSGNEVGLEALSNHSGISKQKLSEYFEYLEAAYLIRRVHRLDDNAKRLQRERTFKVYLTNTSVRAALFGTLGADDDAAGSVAETAVWSQWLHRQGTSVSLHYARWKDGRSDIEVDIVGLDPAIQRPRFAAEIKWSDRILDHPEELKGILALAQKHAITEPLIVTTRSSTKTSVFSGMQVNFRPTAVYCYSIAKQEVLV